MANCTIGREGRCYVAGIGRVLEVALMTTDTCATGQVVVVVDVAGGARNAHVRAGQGEPG